MPSSITKSSFSSMPSSLPSIRTFLARKERAATRLSPANLSQPAPAGRSGATSILKKPAPPSLPERTTQSLHLTSQQSTLSSFRTSSTRGGRAAMRHLPADIPPPAHAARSSGKSVLKPVKQSLPEDTTHSLPEGTTQSLHLTSSQHTQSSFRTLSTRSSRAATRYPPTKTSPPIDAACSGAKSVFKSTNRSLPKGITQSLPEPTIQSLQSSKSQPSTQSLRSLRSFRSQPTTSVPECTTQSLQSRSEYTAQSLQPILEGTIQSLPERTTTLQSVGTFQSLPWNLRLRDQTTQSLQPISEESCSESPVDMVNTPDTSDLSLIREFREVRAWREMRAELDAKRAARQAAVVSKSSEAPRPRLIIRRNSPVAPSLDTTTASLRAERAKKREERLASGSTSNPTREITGPDSKLTRAERFKKFVEERDATKSLVVDASTRKAERDKRIAKRRAELAAEREARTASTMDSSRFTRSSRVQTVSSRSRRTASIVRKEEARPAASAARPVSRPTGRTEAELTDPFVDRTKSTSRSGEKIGRCHTANLEFQERLVAIAAKRLPAPRATCTVSDRSTGRSGAFPSSRRPSERRETGRHTVGTSSFSLTRPQVTQPRSILKPTSSVRFEAGLKAREELYQAEKREGMYTDLLAPRLKITREKGLPTERVSYINIARGPAPFPPWKVPRGYVCPKIQPRKTVRFAESLESVQYFEHDRSNNDLLYYRYEGVGEKRPVSWMTGTMNAPELQKPPRQTMWKSFTLGDRDETAITKFRSGPQRQRVCQVRGFYARQEEEVAEGGTNSALVTVKQYINGFYGLKMNVRGSRIWSGVVLDENDPIECALPVQSFGTMTDREEPGVWKFWSEAYRLNNDMPGYSRYQCWLGGNCVKFSLGRRCVCSGAWVRQVGTLEDLKVVKVSRPKFASGSKVTVTESLPPAYGGNGMTVASAVSTNNDSIITEATGLASPHPRPYVTARGQPENSDAVGDKSMSPAKPYLRGRRIETPVGEPMSPVRTPSPVGLMSAAENEWYRAIVARAMARARNGL